MTLQKSRSLTEATKGELEVVADAVRGMLAPAVKTFFVTGEGVPASIAYVHALIVRGQGDYNNFIDGLFRLNVCDPDRRREPALKGVESVTLEYRTNVYEEEEG